MKNIHLLPTDKPSMFSQHIHITNDEDIKDGDYAYHKVFGVGKIVNIYGEDCFVTIRTSQTDGSITTPWKRNIPDIKKIILTTNPDLVADGVQAIDDKFLEWFVRNPKVECIEVETYVRKIGVETDKNGYREMDTFADFYKIIIPKEKSKEELNFYEELVEYFKTTPREKVLEDWKKSEHYDLIGQTVEEVAENIIQQTFRNAFLMYPKGGHLSNENLTKALTEFLVELNEKGLIPDDKFVFAEEAERFADKINGTIVFIEAIKEENEDSKSH